MLGRIYTFLFMITILFSLWYQKMYLNKSAVEFNAQLMAGNAVLPVITMTNYNSLSFKNGIYKSTFSGKNMVYFSDKHFEATDNLIYQEIISSEKKTSQANLNSGHILITTNKAIGEVMNSQPDISQVMMTKNKLKNVILPNHVDFNFDNNIGNTSHVYIDVLKRTLQSENPIESKGPSGSIKGIGFFYAIDEGEFVIKSDVEGMIIPEQISKD